ncbi:flagellar basal body-associated protein FliL [Burkholderia glumae]|uniref:Flagellar protein FliL n=1 Tax=Burkholderia glumae TaxID=337 RepID=A0ABY5BC23_BURGL|nr:flagellar basal body-associated protein FliL [Burkholderia glumae]ACR32642.1 Flagellar protein FliL [Burkholderia glumae BGR1]KHJ60707.1 flagellar basal body protein FliL [Burkholderia glumae]MCM2495972.1 flagellar basal body-associated protein FliL [Burkholderia glumae]MCM2541768.1 flagellar basal body-associated protein FliL [Burkholderia glumae]MCM2547335.1 flagellar basal body-associated protein FliL [Burkholderia glumae]
MTVSASPAPAPANPSTGKLRRFLLFGLVGLLLAAVGEAAAWYAFLRHEGMVEAAKVGPPPLSTPVYFPMDPMTVNLQSDDEMHYVRIGITLKLTDPSAQDYLTQHMPEIRSRILMALSNKHPQDLATSDDKRQLVAQLRALIERPTQPGNRSARVDQVLITDFVLQ